jgi:hypothetical protein
MMKLTPDGQRVVDELAQRYGISSGAVMTMLQAVVNGNGSMAQFSHPEFGGSGQWMRGGMVMAGDMFNNNLKMLIDNLCNELAQLLAAQQLMQPEPATRYQGQSGPNASLFVQGGSGNWWPPELGSPAASGAQNNVRYAYFPATRRLALDISGQISVYDTQDHQIGGVSQQQGYGASVLFTSQYGTVDVLNLPLISGPGTLATATPSAAAAPAAAPPADTAAATATESDIFGKIERLAELKQKGAISEEEFNTKKAELLSRL